MRRSPKEGSPGRDRCRETPRSQRNMASVWKRLQRVGKHASKFQFVASYQELMVECTKKWWVFLTWPQCCHLSPMKTVCLCLCWNAALVPGGHNSHTLSCLGVQACLHAGRGDCLVKLLCFFSFFHSCAPMANLFSLSVLQRGWLVKGFPFSLKDWAQAALTLLKCPWAIDWNT